MKPTPITDDFDDYTKLAYIFLFSKQKSQLEFSSKIFLSLI